LSEVQTCIWPSWCHCHSLSLASVKSRVVLPFWYRLTQVVLDKGPLNGCVLLLSHSKTITYCSMTNSYILSVIGGSHETFNTIICAIMDAQCTQWQNVICCYKLRCELHTAWLTSHLLLCRDSILVISTVKVVKLYKNIQNVIFSSALESGMHKLQRTFRVKNSDLLNLTDWKQLHKLLNSLTICPK